MCGLLKNTSVKIKILKYRLSHHDVPVFKLGARSRANQRPHSPSAMWSSDVQNLGVTSLVLHVPVKPTSFRVYIFDMFMQWDAYFL